MLKQLQKKEEGIVFLAVLIIILVMMVLTIGMISMNTSQVLVTENEVKRINAQTIGMGALAYSFGQYQQNSSFNSASYTETIDGTDYTVTITVDDSGSGPYGSNPLNITVTY